MSVKILCSDCLIQFLRNRFKENATLNVLSLSKILLVCPNPATVPILQHDNVPKESLYENIWMVDKEGYETCTVDTSRKHNRLLKVCDKPLELTYLEIVLQLFSATLNGLEFIPGREYYFISELMSLLKTLWEIDVKTIF